MQAVGILGSYISRSVYTVSAPFHPFGGAVDIITVQQRDGTYKSSPWYVRFGKFQGVLKTREKVVTISVNGVEADFHMYLNHKGEAYFLTQVDEGDGDPVCSLPSTSGEEPDRLVSNNRMSLKSMSCNYDSKCAENERNVVTRTYSRPYHIFGLVFGKNPMEEDENASGFFKTQSLQRAEIAVDLLDLKWSTNLDSPRRKKNNNNINNASRVSDVSKDEDSGNIFPRSTNIVGTEESVHISGENVVAEYSQPVSIRQTDDQIADKIIIKNRESIISGEEQLLFGNMDGVHESCDAKSCSDFSLDQSVINDYIDNVDPQRMDWLRSVPSESCIKDTDHVEPEGVLKIVRSLPIMGPLSDKLEEERDQHQSPSARTMCEDIKILDESKEGHADPCTTTHPRSIESLNESQRNWPFASQKSKSMEVSQVETNGVENPNAGENKDSAEVTENKKTFIRTLTPTSEQLASLKLKDGKNIIVFTFQTTMLGDQQVDAQIFMWRWDTRIVISDVDGAITRSDLLGQVMPLVGMDWSQTGVAHLFSAVKKNGYQLLFLSARSIAQSCITRQFLFNIKQDGIALPDGPVVISPDGLFPSLFREVVRRAPHEFKIACLEDIKALFPADTNPFYAGFGNRDTDEFSYLKVGIPRGKIFIINPKGEIVVNRCVETKSYLSLHELVHDMFPIITSSEQEDYNSWNYWKIPPPGIDM